MISFKEFVKAIYQAVTQAADSLSNKNEQLLETYFEVSPESDKNDLFTPKIIKLNYPTLDCNGDVKDGIIQVPLISLIPVNTTRIEKATFTAAFELQLVNDELLLNFPDENRSSEKSTFGKLEIIITPQENTKGIDMIIDGYAKSLKRQIT